MNQPRRISWVVRLGVTGAVGLFLSVPLVVVITQPGRNEALSLMAIVGASLGLVFVSLAIGNVGFAPRVNGQYLDVLTVLGRQSLDLAALTGVRCERTHTGTQLLRLRDQITEVVITLPPRLPVREAIREGLAAAAQRGVLLPRRVTTIFSLPEMPGAPRNKSYSYVALIVAFLAVSALLGLVVGLII